MPLTAALCREGSAYLFPSPTSLQGRSVLSCFKISSWLFSVLLFGFFYLKLIKRDLKYFTLPPHSFSSLKFPFTTHVLLSPLHYNHVPSCKDHHTPCFSNRFLFLLSSNWNLPSKSSKTPSCRLPIFIPYDSHPLILKLSPFRKPNTSFFFKAFSLQLLIS